VNGVGFFSRAFLATPKSVKPWCWYTLWKTIGGSDARARGTVPPAHRLARRDTAGPFFDERTAPLGLQSATATVATVTAEIACWIFQASRRIHRFTLQAAPIK